MNGLLLQPALLLAAATPNLREVLACPTFWGLAISSAGLWLLLPGRTRHGATLGGVLLVIAAGLLAADLPLLGNWMSQVVFWLLALLTLAAAIGTITSYSPVYSAIWFALSLVGTSGLFLFQGSEFLGVATIVVYAGAIVVTFLFVIMLAQPEGNASYDRISWGWFPKTFGVLSAAAMVGILAMLLGNMKDTAERPIPAASAAEVQERLSAESGVLSEHHMANLGRHLFGQHLISVEVAGTLLLAALVGAVAIAIHGKPRLATRIEEALE